MVSLKDLSASIWVWHRAGWQERSKNSGRFKKVIDIPAEPADPDQLPPLLQGFKAVPPLITDINLSLDDRFLYVSCWGTGEFIQYDVSDPFHPEENRLGPAWRNRAAAQPTQQPNSALNGGPQMVELSRDGQRIYFTNSLYSPWDEQFYPDGVRELDGQAGRKAERRMELDPKFFVGVRGSASASGPSGRRRRLVGFVLLCSG